MVRASHVTSCRTYGACRVWHDLLEKISPADCIGLTGSCRRKRCGHCPVIVKCRMIRANAS